MAHIERGYGVLPAGRRDERGRFKSPWLSELHGYNHRTASREEISAWPASVEQRIGNGTAGILSLGLVLPADVVGIDVDAYDGKRGLETLQRWADDWGPLPPTYIVTARFDGSGIRLFRKPVDWEPNEQRGSGIDFIDHNHRYVIAAGSWHHTGQRYRLVTPAAKLRKHGILPSPADLPELPPAYIDGLRRTAKAVRGSTATTAEIGEFAAQHTANKAPTYLEPVLRDYRAELAESLDNTHSPTFSVLCRIARESRAGAYSFKPAVATVRKLAEQHYQQRDRTFDRADFTRLVGDAVAAAKAENLADLRARLFRDYGTDTRKADPVTGSTNEANWWDDLDDQPSSQPWEKYPLTSPAELASAITPARWLVSGVWIEKSAGVIAGKKKAFKTWQMHALGMSVATGCKYLDEFSVVTQGPVIYLSGEGGEVDFMSRHQAIAKRYDSLADLADVPFHSLHKIAPLDDGEYLDALRHHLDAVQPVLVVIDPLYAYHPQGIDVANVYSRGQMLAQIRSEIEPYAALVIGDHINKSADNSRLDLDDIGFSGVSQWADSWSLQRHRVPFHTVGADSFAKLEVEFGTRRTGSMRHDIDWHLVRDRSDPHVVKWDSCDWSVNQRSNSEGSANPQVLNGAFEAIAALQDHVDVQPYTNKTNTVKAMVAVYEGFSRGQWRELWDKAIKDGYLVSVKRTEQQPYRDSSRLVEIEAFKRGREIGKGGAR
nr:AAA family ATPase [Mycolicibacterium hippocampi]